MGFGKIFLVFILLSPSSIFAQAEANFWYFGKNAGLDFSQSKPQSIKNGALNTIEGCASISDANGNLLFYTDGITVWNRKHQWMPNGTGLTGDLSATQSAIIVPKPNSKTIYYIFTTDVAEGASGLRYSTVEMSLAGGLGDVKMKNIALMHPVTERITAVLHQNRTDYWILTHQWESNAFYAFLLTEKGIQANPIISEVGRNHTTDPDNAIGMMKASPDGKRLAVAMKGLHLFEIFDFDYNTGKLANPISIQMENGSLTYGLEFSSDASKLYVAAHGKNKIYQYDLKDAKNIKNSGKIIAQDLVHVGSLQLAPNGKIYATVYDLPYLSVIENPNLRGDSCRFIKEGIFLEGARCQLGLPNFIPTYFDDLENIQKITTVGNRKIKIGQAFTKNILFETDKSDILPEYFKELDELVDYLQLVKNIKVEIAGHTDNEGLDSKNLSLSESRAKAIADYLIHKGIDATRVKAIGFGKTKPIAPNTTTEGKKLNRRIEFLLTR